MMVVEDEMVLPMATLLVAGILGLMLVFLSARVIILRYARKVGIGDGGHPDLAQAIRVHANFVEYVPLALILLILVEHLDYAPWVAWLMGGLLIVGRVAHAFALTRSTGPSVPRVVGVVLTFAVLLIGSILSMTAFFGG